MKLLRRLSALFAFSALLSCMNAGDSPSWPGPVAGQALELLLVHTGVAGMDTQAPPLTLDADVVRRLPVCVASRSWSAGELGHSILYRYQREGRKLTVGYFVYWTTERPWGKNLLSYSVLPALLIDAFYSHLFFLFPGAQRFIHGPGDVEGARVVYEQRDDGRWVPVSAVADDGLHHETPLAAADFVDQDGRVVLMTDVWSHQLGAKGARSFSEKRKDALVCFDGGSIAPLTDEIAQLFRLGTQSSPRRARPAWRFPGSAVTIAYQGEPTPDEPAPN